MINMILSEQLCGRSWAGKIDRSLHRFEPEPVVTFVVNGVSPRGVEPGRKASEKSPNVRKTSQNNCNAAMGDPNKPAS